MSGLIVLTLMQTTDTRTVGIAFLVESLTALGDMSNVLGSGGSKQAAFSIHGVTFAVMVITRSVHDSRFLRKSLERYRPSCVTENH